MDIATRRRRLSEAVQRALARGGRIESQSQTSAVIVVGRPVNHLLHAAIGLFTWGLWWVVWFFMIRAGGEHRLMLDVREDGRVYETHLARTDDNPTMTAIAGVLAGLAVLWIAVVLIAIVVASSAAGH